MRTPIRRFEAMELIANQRIMLRLLRWLRSAVQSDLARRGDSAGRLEGTGL
jgi:hypothetical protein